MNAVLALQRLAVDAVDLGIETYQESSYSGSGCIAGLVDTGEG